MPRNVKAAGITGVYHTSDAAQMWELESVDNIGNYYASPVCGDGKIGTAVVIGARPEAQACSSETIWPRAALQRRPFWAEESRRRRLLILSSCHSPGNPNRESKQRR